MGQFSGTGHPHADVYIRRRIYSSLEGLWTTVDPLWPFQAAYSYVSQNPMTFIDPSGSRPIITVRSPAPDRLRFAQKNDCKVAYSFMSAGNAAVLARYNACMAESGVSCPPMTQSLAGCLAQHVCLDHIVFADIPNTCGKTSPQGSVTMCPIQLRHLPYCDHYHVGAQYHIVLLHEMLHVCGVDHPENILGDDKCNNVMACCMLRATGLLGISTRCTTMARNPG